MDGTGCRIAWCIPTGPHTQIRPHKLWPFQSLCPGDVASGGFICVGLTARRKIAVRRVTDYWRDVEKVAMRGTKDSEWRCTELTLGLDTRDISRFSPRIDRIFPGEALNPFFGAQDKGFSDFVLDNCILDFDAEQVYVKLQVTNLKNKEVTVNPQP